MLKESLACQRRGRPARVSFHCFFFFLGDTRIQRICRREKRLVCLVGLSVGIGYNKV